MTQLPLPLVDAKESQLERCRRVLNLDPKRVTTAAKYFNADGQRHANAVAARDGLRPPGYVEI